MVAVIVVMVMVVIMIVMMLVAMIVAVLLGRHSGLGRAAIVVNVRGGIFVEFHNASSNSKGLPMRANAPQDHYKGRLQSHATGLQVLKIK